MGTILRVGDTVLGYDLTVTNFNPSDVKPIRVF